MKKYIATLIVLIAFVRVGCAQELWWNSINQHWAAAKHDTTRVLLLAEFANYYKNKKPDSTIIYGYKGLALARKINFPKGEVKAIQYMSRGYWGSGNDSKTLQLTLQAIKICEKNKFIHDKAHLMQGLGQIYNGSMKYEKALTVFKDSRRIFDLVDDSASVAQTLNFIGQTYLAMNQIDSALFYAQSAYENAFALDHFLNGWLFNPILLNLGNIQREKGNSSAAMSYYKQSLSKAREPRNSLESNFAIAQLYKQNEILDSAILYANKSLDFAKEGSAYQMIIDSYILLSDIYELNDLNNSLQFSKKAIAYKDSLNNFVKVTMQQTYADFDEQERKREIEAAKIESQNQLRMNAFLGSTFTLIVITIFLFIISRRKQMAKQKIESAFNQLKSTQSQLIQSEKMASLGELTAGIAHEIQNPLNFVNNFSEVSKELANELIEEVQKIDIDKGLISEIAGDISLNQEKINQHGHRASGIVKGMLEHSRAGDGKKEPTDINGLCDEYLRLAYHGMRAKDKSFNVNIETDFDPTLPLVEVVPQDMGRVVLNLITNAFYAVTESKNGPREHAPLSALGNKIDPREHVPLEEDPYQPTVIVATCHKGIPLGDALSLSKRAGGERGNKDQSIEIRVKDNGTGIPQDILDKIFQPFFTTKPTGKGTGLGLSLSYDIVKAHGGELRVESPPHADAEACPGGRPALAQESGQAGTEFIITIPIKS